MKCRFSLSALLIAMVFLWMSPATSVAQDSKPSVSVGVGDATDISLTAPIKGNLSLLVSSTRQNLTEDSITVTVSHLTGGVRYAQKVRERLALYADVGFGGWFGDGVLNPRDVWRDVSFRLGSKFYMTDSWGFGLSAGYRRVGEDFEISKIILRPSETPWTVSLFGDF